LRTVDQVGAAFKKRVGTGELNRFFEAVLKTHPPPTSGGKAPRVYYVTQAESRPPVFVVMASDPDKLHFSYRRYVSNQLRKTFAFDGVPIRVHYKARRRRERGAPRTESQIEKRDEQRDEVEGESREAEPVRGGGAASRSAKPHSPKPRKAEPRSAKPRPSTKSRGGAKSRSSSKPRSGAKSRTRKR
jgi:hypothetical protein